MKSRKILFLDFDHVLNTSETLEKGILFAKKNVDALNAILDNIEVYIVVTSMWRIAATVEELEELLVQAGVHAVGRVLGATPCMEDCPRGAEIMTWLEQSQQSTDEYVILDNREDMDQIISHLVQTDPRYGLIQEQVDEIVSLFSFSQADGY